ncbi:MAG: NUDIX hydrolase [Candidatus Nanohaloarchaea archaeon]
MSLLIRLRNVLEYWLVRTIGRYLWAPPSAAVLVEDDRGVLALNVDGHYELPGGLIRAGEDPRTAARREVREETGMEIDVGDLIDFRTSQRGNAGLHFFFEGDVVGGDLDGSWEGDPEFVPVDEVRQKVWRLHHAHVDEYLFPSGDTGE